MLIEQVLMQIRDDPSLQWPKPISTSLERRDKSKYCRFHQDHRHSTDEYRHLKDQVETLIQQGKLQKYIKKIEPHKYQRKDNQQNSGDTGYQTSCRRNKDDLERTNSRWNIEIPKKGIGKGNKQHPFSAPSNGDAKE